MLISMVLFLAAFMLMLLKVLLLGYGEKTYFATLRGLGILFKDNGVNLPKREYINQGYFEVKEEPYESNGNTYLYSRVYVTAKGLLWLEKKTPKVA